MRTGALRRIRQQPGTDPETLRNWVIQAEIDGGDRPATTTSDAQRLAELAGEARELRRDRWGHTPSEGVSGVGGQPMASTTSCLGPPTKARPHAGIQPGRAWRAVATSALGRVWRPSSPVGDSVREPNRQRCDHRRCCVLGPPR
jgi:hypothetical protein